MQPGLELGGRYVIEELLGQGGMGEVWRGADRLLDRPVAVKVMRQPLADQELAARFQREARLAARLRHPGITVVHDIGSHDGRPFIIMELLDGHDLAETLRTCPTGLAVDVGVSLAIQVAQALQAAHASQIVHRDLKPANLFLQNSGGLKICDFGIARASDLTTNLTSYGQAVGTAYYMSPEQCLGQLVDARSDLYSLGCVLYELLTGRPPFPDGPPLAIMYQHMNTAPVSLRAARPDIQAELDRLVLQLLAKEPESRPADAGSVAAALISLRERGLTAAAPMPTDPTTQPSPAPATTPVTPENWVGGGAGRITSAPRRSPQPLTRGQRIALMTLSVLVFPLALPAALVRISQDRSMTERTASAILIGYGSLAFLGTLIAEIIINIRIGNHHGYVPSVLTNDRIFVGLFGALLSAAYLTGGIRMRRTAEN